MNHQVLRPSHEQLGLLSSFERNSFRLADYINSHGITKRASHFYLRTVGAKWVYFCSRNLLHTIGLDNLAEIDSTRGIVLASNHRSFYDQFVLSSILFRKTKLLKRIYFPIRAEYFYQEPAGVLLGLAMAGMSMYPPIFREPTKRKFNTYSVERLVQILKQPGSVVGLHPEGTRNKGTDSYSLLKAQPGIGKLIMEAKPTVLPIFLNGLRNEFLAQLASNFNGNGSPVIAVFGKPLQLESFYEKPNKLRTHKEIADYVLGAIAELGQIEKTRRAALEGSPLRGPILE